MPEWNEIRKLAQLLHEAGIPFELLTYDALGVCLKIPSCEAWYEDRAEGRSISVIQNVCSYGGREGLLEVWTRGDSDVKGWLTADQALQLIRKEYSDGMG